MIVHDGILLGEIVSNVWACSRKHTVEGISIVCDILHGLTYVNPVMLAPKIISVFDRTHILLAAYKFSEIFIASYNTAFTNDWHPIILTFRMGNANFATFYGALKFLGLSVHIEQLQLMQKLALCICHGLKVQCQQTATLSKLRVRTNKTITM